AADAKDPAILGVAGLDNPSCEAVLALTGDEETNLQIVMACRLLRPDVTILARAVSRRVSEAMRDFSPTAVINAFDEYGHFLLMSLHQPNTYRLLMWLMAEAGTELQPLPPAFTLRRWLVISDGNFGDEITRDLTAVGHQVNRIEPDGAADADLSQIDAIVCGSESDATNLALAAHARRIRPEAYLAVRVMSHQRLLLLEAFKPDSVFFPPGLITQQVLVHLVNPHYWQFVQAVMAANDSSAHDMTERLVARLTTRAPVIRPLKINDRETPAVSRWLSDRPLKIGDLFRSPQDRDVLISAVPLFHVRGKKRTILPDDDLELHLDDELVIAGQPTAFRGLTEVTYDDSTLHYVVTGRDIPTSWIAQAISRRHRAGQDQPDSVDSVQETPPKPPQRSGHRPTSGTSARHPQSKAAIGKHPKPAKAPDQATPNRSSGETAKTDQPKGQRKGQSASPKPKPPEQ
ncbi:MAG: NAD-binding protein, partial [Propionibacteriaceae bacterium]|nr:NAD-binding protein [Propionibacteriaceae bacterium]